MTECQFGYYPKPINIEFDGLSILTSPNLNELVKLVSHHPQTYKDWYYANPACYNEFVSDTKRDLPYPNRVFSLPKTHSIKSDLSLEETDFFIWALSFFTGMRLTSTEAGFLDSTIIKPNILFDFIIHLNSAVKLSYRYAKNKNNASKLKNTSAIIHCLFLSNNPQSLPFEKFQYLYYALDGCFQVIYSSCKGKKPNHADRITWCCKKLGIPTPEFAITESKPTIVSRVRNETMHEALFYGEPLGFAISEDSTSLELNRETAFLIRNMEKLVCRMIVSIFNMNDSKYAQSPISPLSRSKLLLEFDKIL
ncbi:hypothetical protein ABN057_15580 [Providencia alcalifaciens]|uniref:hypothetical protein n=1 Tax=Providencia TaxID=586 RepID=UPI001C23D5B0|nr:MULTISPECIES: hypothetical protein [Providencia]QXB91402.1 hypothetical protein I6L81_20000 [Providencia rettgeri]